MSYSKRVIFTAFLVVVALVLLLVFARTSNTEQRVTEAISILKQGDDRSRECEAFNILVTLSPSSRRATSTIAEMYARGMCKPFDLEKAIEWYRKIDLGGEELGRALFKAARWEIPVDGKGGVSKTQILDLLKKIKELGYVPNRSELDHLTPEFQAVFR